MFLGEDEIAADAAVVAVGAAAGEAGTEQRLYIRGDASADYGLIMQLMGDLAAAGYSRIGLITTQREVP